MVDENLSWEALISKITLAKFENAERIVEDLTYSVAGFYNYEWLNSGSRSIVGKMVDQMIHTREWPYLDGINSIQIQ